MTLGHQFAARLPPMVNPTFVSLIQQIRGNGVDVFLDQIRRQQDLLLECLEGAQGLRKSDFDIDNSHFWACFFRLLYMLQCKSRCCHFFPYDYLRHPPESFWTSMYVMQSVLVVDILSFS